MNRYRQNMPRNLSMVLRGIYVSGLLGGLVVFQPAKAQAEPPAASPPPPAQDCAAVTDNGLKAFLLEAQERLDAIWLKSQSGWVAAYEFAGDGKNPLLPNAATEPPVAPIRGFVFASGWGCTLRSSPDGLHAVVTYRAKTYRFNESSPGWTAAATDGVVLTVLGNREKGPWTLVPGSADDTIFPPGTKLMRPAAEAIPPHAVWPSKDCRPPKLWLSGRCIRPQVAPPKTGP